MSLFYQCRVYEEVKMRRFLVYVLALLLLVGGELETHQLYTREDASGEG